MYNYAHNYISFICTVSIIIIVIYRNKEFDFDFDFESIGVNDCLSVSNKTCKSQVYIFP